MKGYRLHTVLLAGLALVLATAAYAQRSRGRVPRIGYVYPAGGQQGTSFQVTVGGQYLSGATGALVSGDGVTAKLRPQAARLTRKQYNQLRTRLQTLLQTQKKRKQKDPAVLKEIAEIRKKLAGFNKKKPATPAIGETVFVEVTVAPDAPPGRRELRLVTSNGLTNPLVFCVDQLPEFSPVAAETASAVKLASAFKNNRGTGARQREPEPVLALPVMINGQITPGEVDRYRFAARRGQRVVVAAKARALIPYLADAVPGWFQAALAVYDDQGNELAYDDDFRFDPDPALVCEIPEDGQYVIEIRDAIYRGREDFVYRIAVGELPYLTDIFPLGGPVGKTITVALRGWNLPATSLTISGKDRQPGIYPLRLPRDWQLANRVPFAFDTLPECLEQEPNDNAGGAQSVTLPILINGRIGRRGDRDVFRFQGRAGQPVVAEVYARRLGSPLDSLLKLTDASGQQLALNDDHEDKASGLTTHHADSWLSCTLPTDGVYQLVLEEAQQAGGPEYAYRLRISPPRPDFALRIVPSSIIARNSPKVPITVYAVRKDGFSGQIALELQDAPEGFELRGGLVPAGQDQASVTLTVVPAPQPVSLHVVGRATIGGQTVVHPAAPADDMMQAFAYHHLVPAQELKVAVLGRVRTRRFSKPAGKGAANRPAGKGPFRIALRVDGKLPVRIPAGGTAAVKLAAARPMYLGNIKLQLQKPPDGIAIQQVSVSRGRLQVVLQADRAKVEPGQRGRLRLRATRGKTAPKSKTPKSRPAPLAWVPQIPFVITEPR